MKTKALLLTIVCLAVSVLNGTVYSQPSPTDEQIRAIEEAVFEDLDGNELDLSHFEGKVVLIDVWETWCTPCLRSFPTLQELMEDYPDDFVVLALSPGFMDSPDQVKSFAEEHDYDFTYAFGQELARTLQISSIPYKLYVDPDGKYITTKIGSQGPQQDYEKTREIIEGYRQ